jgi:predicted Zn-dependent peptidase
MYQQTRLDNGLRIVCETVPGVHSVSLGVWVGTGSRYEEPALNGISHFIEHMMFKGTGRRTTKQIAEAIDAVGGQLNAFTTKEYTCYYAKLLHQHFQFGIDLLADMITGSLFQPEELEKEKQVVLEEIKSFEDSPDELVHDLFAETVLKGHPLGWTILGSPETVSRIDRPTILDYLSHHYTPDNMVFAVAGNVQFDQIVAEIEARLAHLAGRTGRQLAPIPSLEPDVVLRPKETEQVHICLGTRGVGRKDPDRYPVFVLDSILGGSVSSRLFQQLREERGLVYVAGSSHAAYRDTGIFSIYAGTSLKNYDEVVAVIKTELQKLQQEPVGPEELARAKEQLKGNLLLSLESTCNRMSRIAKLTLFDDPLLAPEENVARVEAVSAEQVQRVASNLFNEERLVISAIGPFDAAAGPEEENDDE